MIRSARPDRTAIAPYVCLRDLRRGSGSLTARPGMCPGGYARTLNRNYGKTPAVQTVFIAGNTMREA